MAELALATRSLPRDWEEEDDAMIATVLDLLRERAEAMKRASGRG